jgi:sarcosine oxidase
MNHFDVVVVGLGAVGAAALYQLSQTGKKVLGIDRFDPPHTMGSSHGETRITRLAVGEGAEYVNLARRSHEIWKSLEAKTGHQIYFPVGGILMDSGIQPWGKHGADGFFDRTVSYAKQFEVRHEVLDSAQLKKRFTNFDLPASGKAYFEYEAGFLKPELAIQTQLNLAKENGAEILTNSPVLDIQKNQGGGIKLILEGKEITAGRVLVSAGGWVKDFLTEPDKNEFKICRQVLHWVETDSDDWKDYPVFMWGFGPAPEDFIYGFPSLDGKTVKMATESFVETSHPSDLNREVSREEQAHFLEIKVKGKISGLQPKILKSTVCFYTVTEDAKFVVRPIAGMEEVLMVSACSGHGFKHSAALGELLKNRLTN